MQGHFSCEQDKRSVERDDWRKNEKAGVRGAVCGADLCDDHDRQDPSACHGGYVNLGDCVVLLAGWVLGPMYGGAAAGLGSMLADLVSGYPLYAPGTFVIKACMAVCAWAVFRAAAGEKRGLAARIGGALAGEAVMVAGYFAYEGVVLGFGLGAAAAIPGNLIQGVFGLAVSVAAAEALSRSGAVKEL